MNHIPRDRPWMIALETQIAALRMVAASRSHPDLIKFRQFHRLCETTLKQASAYAWSDETVSAVVLASKTVPLDTRLNDFDPHSAWWWLGDNFPAFTTDVHGFRTRVHAISIGTGVNTRDEQRGVFVTQFAADMDGVNCPVPMTRFFWPFGATIAETESIQSGEIDEISVADDLQSRQREINAIHKESLRITARFVVAAIAWMEQKIVVANSGHVERHRRKQIAREHDAHIPEVKVVQLRRIESSSRAHDGGQPVEWSCRWIVNGHWRNQYHPSTGTHTLKYILPYVKGPDDKPLKAPDHTVYEVTR